VPTAPSNVRFLGYSGREMLAVRLSHFDPEETLGSRLAQLGCSANVIAAISGHSTLREVSRYTAAADQVRLARQGIEALTRTKTGKPEPQIGKPASKALK
jgi:hypothetical protein